MRLDDFDPNAINVEDQRGSGGGFPMGRGGQVGCGTLVIALILSAVLGVDPGQLIGGLQQAQPQEQSAPAQAGGTDTSTSCRLDQASKESCDTLYSLNQTWAAVFGAANVKFAPPKLVFYSQAGSSGCGAAQSALYIVWTSLGTPWPTVRQVPMVLRRRREPHGPRHLGRGAGPLRSLAAWTTRSRVGRMRQRRSRAVARRS